LLAGSLGCGHSGRGEIGGIAAEAGAAKETATTQAGPRVALIMKTLTNPFFVEMEKGARRAQTETKVDLQVKTATQETSIEQQIELVEREIKAQAKAIVIAPGDSMRLVPVLKKAQDAGIPIVNIDNRLRPDAMAAAGMKPVPFISVDNEQGAFLAAKYLAGKAKVPTEAAILEGIRSAVNAQLRKAGAERGLQTRPGIKLVASETANWKIDEAYEVTRKLFKSHPHLGVLFCANDMMAIGAIKYLQEAGRGDVLVGGFDALAEARTAIQAGQLAVTVDQQADLQGYLGVMTAQKLMRGEAVPTELKVDVRLVTPESLK
jgi:ribose transport system substrate-binding protein